MKSLFDLTTEYTKSLIELEKQFIDGEISSALENHVSEILIEQGDKVDNYCIYISKLEHDIKHMQEMVDLACEVIKKKNGAIGELKSLATRAMLSNNIPRLEGNQGHVISFRKSTQVVIDCEIERLPAKYVQLKMEYHPDKKALKCAIESGEEIDGVRIIEKKNVQFK